MCSSWYNNWVKKVHVRNWGSSDCVNLGIIRTWRVTYLESVQAQIICRNVQLIWVVVNLSLWLVLPAPKWTYVRLIRKQLNWGLFQQGRGDSFCCRLCSLTLSRLMVLRPLGSDLSSIIIAVKIQVSKINYYKINVFHELCGIRYRRGLHTATCVTHCGSTEITSHPNIDSVSKDPEHGSKIFQTRK